MTDRGEIILARLEDLFARRGAEAYLGEPVTVAQHMLQCADLARAEGAPDALVAAALLHDIGHLTGPLGEYTQADTFDRRHEQAGAETLAGAFLPAVVEAVRLHVDAKRYLCAADATYRDRLTPASQHTLSLQGGPMSPAEVAAFEARPHHEAAVQVRLWDDAGKDAARAALAFADFRPLLQRLIESHAAAAP
ncbi:MAG: HD domain-containing protein [Proteobacteria bacterium]|nr:HD domain-containing protein [Pseudomonadota bacterium]